MNLRPFALALLVASLWAADPLADFNTAMAGSDLATKRAAMSALAGSDLPDDVVLPLLVGAVGDRQAGSDAIQALRGRTKLSPPSRRGASKYPDYPGMDDAAGWSAWLSARSEDMKQRASIQATQKAAEQNQAAIAANAKRIGEVAGTASGADTASGAATASGAELSAVTERPRWVPPPELGRIDRILLKSGGSVLAYIQSKRLDPDGKLVSVRIVHPESGGEETLSAELVARIEEDVR